MDLDIDWVALILFLLGITLGVACFVDLVVLR